MHLDKPNKPILTLRKIKFWKNIQFNFWQTSFCYCQKLQSLSCHCFLVWFFLNQSWSSSTQKLFASYASITRPYHRAQFKDLLNHFLRFDWTKAIKYRGLARSVATVAWTNNVLFLSPSTMAIFNAVFITRPLENFQIAALSLFLAKTLSVMSVQATLWALILSSNYCLSI